MKPIKCWDCAHLGGCNDYNKNGCEKFMFWKMTFREVAALCKISERCFYRWFERNEEKALLKVNNLTGYKFKIYHDDRGKRYLVRKLNKE